MAAPRSGREQRDTGLAEVSRRSRFVCGLLVAAAILLCLSLSLAAAEQRPGTKPFIFFMTPGPDGKPQVRSVGMVIDRTGIFVGPAAMADHLREAGLTLQEPGGRSYGSPEVLAVDRGDDIALYRAAGVSGYSPPPIKAFRPPAEGLDAVVHCGAAAPVEARLMPGGREGEVVILPRSDLPAFCHRAPVSLFSGETAGFVTLVSMGKDTIAYLLPVAAAIRMIDRYRTGSLARSYFELGIIYDTEGNAADASEAYRRAVSLDPLSAAASNNLAAALGREGRFDEALQASRRAIGLRPDFGEAYFNMAVIYETMGRQDLAIEALKGSTTVMPGFAKAHDRLGVLYGKKGDYAAAHAAARRAVELGPEIFAFRLHLAIAAAGAGSGDEARRALAEAFRLRPDADEARYVAAIVYNALGDREAADAEYRLLRKKNSPLAERMKPTFEK